MVVALLRIIHTGLQDERLIPPRGQPALDSFKKVFLRGGKFTTSWVRLDYDTRPAFGTTATLTLPRQGHLITRLYMVTTMPDIATNQKEAIRVADISGNPCLGPTFGWTNSLGHALVSQASIDIGGARVEQITGQLMEVLDEFQTPLEKVTSVNRLLPRIQNGFNTKSIGWDSTPTVSVTPLPFWFCRGDPGVAFPIDATGADSVRLSITFAPLNALYVSSAQVKPSNTSVGEPGSAYFPLAGATFYQQVGPSRTNTVSNTAQQTTTVVTGDNCGSTVSSKVITGLLPPGQIATVIDIPGVSMPSMLSMGDSYVMAEYVYLDRPAANQFRISDIQYPIVQHYMFDPVDTVGQPKISIPLRIPNPCRDLYFFAQRIEAPAYNAPFLATRDLSGSGVLVAPWWPDCSGLTPLAPGKPLANLDDLIAGFSTRDSEPIQSVSLIYEGKMVRYTNMAPSVFRSLLPSYEQRKSPWLNRYYYNMSFGMQNGLMPPSIPTGEANMDKIEKVSLELQMKPLCGSMNPNNVPRFRIFVFAETYNILRIYGGRAGLLFGY